MKKLFLILAALSLSATIVLGQENDSHAMPQVKSEKVWFAAIYMGYNLRVARMDPTIANPAQARSGFKLGGEIQHLLGSKRRVALGATAEWIFSFYTAAAPYGNIMLEAKLRSHTIYIAPVLTFIQPLGNGRELYEDISIGYTGYIESAYNITGMDFAHPLKGKSSTVGYRLSLGYRFGDLDLKYSLFSGSISRVTFTYDGERVMSGTLATSLSLASMSLTLGLRF